MTVETLIAVVSRGVELAGISVIVLGAIISTVVFLAHLRPTSGISDAYRVYRQWIGRAILLGLEFLVAADIIRTVAISPTFMSVGVLAAIVLIRTFLSMTLELETNGHWPWEHPSTLGGPQTSPPSTVSQSHDISSPEGNLRTDFHR